MQISVSATHKRSDPPPPRPGAHKTPTRSGLKFRGLAASGSQLSAGLPLGDLENKTPTNPHRKPTPRLRSQWPQPRKSAAKRGVDAGSGATASYFRSVSSITSRRYGGYHRRVRAYRRRQRRALLHRRVSRPAVRGLSQQEVTSRVERGLTNRVPDTTSRSLWQIFRANVFTLFNAIVGTCFLLLLLLGQWQDALFGLAAAGNAVIGVVEEYRAKKSLDRLAVLGAPHARVLREGEIHDIATADVVKDDLLALRARGSRSLPTLPYWSRRPGGGRIAPHGRSRPGG